MAAVENVMTLVSSGVPGCSAAGTIDTAVRLRCPGCLHPCGGGCKTYIPVEGVAKLTSRWKGSQNCLSISDYYSAGAMCLVHQPAALDTRWFSGSLLVGTILPFCVPECNSSVHLYIYPRW